MGRPRVKINLEILRQLRRAGLGWRTIARRYYGMTSQDISWMTLKRRLIEAALFKKGEKATIIIHNASAANKNLELSHLMEGRLPTKIEVVIANLDEDYSGSIPAVQTVTTENNLELPPYSVTRLLWE